MLEHRRSPRYRASARAHIRGIMDGENLLKDISLTGCCVESPVNADIQPGIQYQLDIEPEKSASVGNFQLLVEQKWKRPGEISTEIGFLIIASPKGKQFQLYIDYLSYRNSAL